MKKVLLLIFSLTIDSGIMHGQVTTNWTNWITIYEGVQLSFKLKDCHTAGGEAMTPYGYWRINNEVSRDKCWVSFKFDYEDCKGTRKTFQAKASLAKSGVLENTDWFLGYKITRTFYDVKYEDYNHNSTNQYPKQSDSDKTELYQEQLRKQEQERKQQAILKQVNQIQQQQKKQSQQIWDGVGSVTGLLGQMQRNNIKRYAQDIINQRDQAFQSLKQDLITYGGDDLTPCKKCYGNGIVDCGKCYGDPFSTCYLCRGSGKVQNFGSTTACGTCYGQGKTACSKCSGVGFDLCSSCFGKGYDIVYAKKTDTYKYPDIKSSAFDLPSYTVSATIQKIWVDFDVQNNGMLIHIQFDVNNVAGKKGQCAAYFYFANGTALNDINGYYKTSNGQVATHSDFVPDFQYSTYKDLSLFLPIDELHITEKGKHNLKFHVQIHLSDNDGTIKNFATSEWQYFTLTQN